MRKLSGARSAAHCQADQCRPPQGPESPGSRAEQEPPFPSWAPDRRHGVTEEARVAAAAAALARHPGARERAARSLYGEARPSVQTLVSRGNVLLRGGPGNCRSRNRGRRGEPGARLSTLQPRGHPRPRSPRGREAAAAPTAAVAAGGRRAAGRAPPTGEGVGPSVRRGGVGPGGEGRRRGRGRERGRPAGSRRRAARPGPQAAAPAPRADAKPSPPPDPPPRRRITHLFVGEIAPARPSD